MNTCLQLYIYYQFVTCTSRKFDSCYFHDYNINSNISITTSGMFLINHVSRDIGQDPIVWCSSPHSIQNSSSGRASDMSHFVLLGSANVSDNIPWMYMHKFCCVIHFRKLKLWIYLFPVYQLVLPTLTASYFCRLKFTLWLFSLYIFLSSKIYTIIILTLHSYTLRASPRLLSPWLKCAYVADEQYQR